MYESILLHDPPHPHIPPKKEARKRLPDDLSNFQGIDFTIATTPEQIHRCFQSLVSHLRRETPKNNFKLISFIFTSLEASMFPLFVKSNLCECIASALDKIYQDSKNDNTKHIDDIILTFLTRLNIPLMQSLSEPTLQSLQHLIIKLKFVHSANLLRSMYSSIRFTKWVISQNRNGYSLQMILNSILPARILELPPELASEIARCLVISSLMLNSLPPFEIQETQQLLVSCISRFLKYRPEAFANASTVVCLREVATRSLIAPPLCEARKHPELVGIPNILQLIRFWIFNIGTKNINKLINYAAICPTLQAEIYSQHYKLFENDPKANYFFKRSLVIDSIANNMKFDEIPSDLHELAIFLISHSSDTLIVNAYTKQLGNIIAKVYRQIKELPPASSDANLMISCAKIMCSLISFESNYYQKMKIEGYEPLSPHFFCTAVAVGQAILSSPLYPHFPTKNYVSFLLKSAFDELSGICASRPKEFLTYLLNVSSNPAKCLMFCTGLNYPLVRDNHHNTWKNYIAANLSDVLKMGLSLLKVPNNITTGIVANFYLTIVKFAIKTQFTHKLLYGILMAPINLFNSVSEMALQTEPIYSAKTTICFLGFIEKILENPFVKSFFLVNVNINFWNRLKFFVSPEVSAISGQLAARSLKIIAKLSDYCNTINPQITGGQRILIDTIHYNVLIDIIKVLNQISECNFATFHDRGVIALSAAELLLSWCYPHPITEIVRNELNPEFIPKIRNMAKESGPLFEPLVNSILNQVEENLKVVNNDQALEEFISLEENLPKFAPSKRLCGMFFRIVESYYKQSEK
ncbi:hypothetical protein TRFO_42699 [Tritrichomonas foetus]|uniref:Uncharacterized protein n=1 Tax=Tritrichomonas foetus TaxID=1144522 RepID=A0A1J4KV76_9EUKA|nr:hypothetical protein TRFO_42699 [Tritrichomonas foetus]|eukprot:OHT15135.1 hypothetical protein TRFO_42699 [Tritrichomonas foetus]